MRTLVTDCEALNHLQSSTEYILAELLAVSKLRNLIVHSRYEGFDGAEPPSLRLKSSRVKGDYVYMRKERLSLSELKDIADRINKTIPGQLVLRVKLSDIHNALVKSSIA